MKNLKPIKVKIFYDENLQKITGKEFEETIVSENLDFATFLGFIFSSYPKIPKSFIPGTLGFLLNGIPPKENDAIKDGDELKMVVEKLDDIRKRIESELREIISYYNVDCTIEEIKEIVLNERNSKDFNNLVQTFAEKIPNLDKLNAVLKFVNAAWNYFPHASLNGLCSTEAMAKFRRDGNKGSVTINCV